MFFVVNASRPFMRDFDSAFLALKDIENMSGLKVTGIVNNTHMMWDTTSEIFEEGRGISKKLSSELNIPFVFSCVSVDSILEKRDFYDENIFKMDLYFLNKI
ncbi:ATP/GTP-binding protein, partial [bacterium]|nr:ATP/GTP-binding protein [bacterium]